MYKCSHLVIFFAILFIGPLIYSSMIIKTLPGQREVDSKFHLENLDHTIKVYDNNKKKIYEFSPKIRYMANLDDIPNHLIHAFLSAEDKNFMSHIGIDFTAILRSLWMNISRAKIIQGGSTITQQLVKGLFLKNEKTFLRKSKEAFLALKIEFMMSKEKILETYLNHIYLGNQAYGVEAASRVYFNKNVSRISLGESALLAALPKAPSFFAPHKHWARAIGRQNVVLRRMHKNGYLTLNELNYWLQNPPKIVSPEIKGNPYNSYFIDMTESEIMKKFSLDGFFDIGAMVYTSLDQDLQMRISKLTKKIYKMANYSQLAKREESTYDKDKIEVALIVLNQQNGQIVSISGGHNYKQTQFNRSFYTKRVVKSLLVPLLQSLAIHRGFDFSEQNSDYDHKSFLEYFLAGDLKIMNLVTKKIGIDEIHTHLLRIGLRKTRKSQLLQAKGIKASLRQLAQGYSTISNGGLRIDPSSITLIQNSSNITVYRKKSESKERFMSMETSYIISQGLKLYTNVYHKNIASEFADSFVYPEVSDDLKNAWILMGMGNNVSAAWVGSEFGGLKIADSKTQIMELLELVAMETLKSMDKMSAKRVAGPSVLKVGFKRVKVEGTSYSLPFKLF